MIVALTTTAPPQRMNLSAVPWEAYVGFCDGIGERHIRMTYDQGELEIMSLSPEHEREKSRLWRVVELIGELMDIEMEYGGSMTCRNAVMLRALEPDECYWIQHAADVLDLPQIDLDRDPPPDLALEIEISRSMLNRLSIYAALRVPEVWRWDGEALTVHLLKKDGDYRVSKRSKAFPFLPLADLVSVLTTSKLSGSRFDRVFRAWVRENRANWAK